MEVKTVLEGLLFLCGDEGLTMEQMQGTLETSREEVESALVQLKEEYDKETHGIELTRFGGIYKFVSKAAVYPYAEKLFASTKMASLSGGDGNTGDHCLQTADHQSGNRGNQGRWLRYDDTQADGTQSDQGKRPQRCTGQAISI